jgi:hypothetical protein
MKAKKIPFYLLSARQKKAEFKKLPTIWGAATPLRLVFTNRLFDNWPHPEILTRCHRILGARFPESRNDPALLGYAACCAGDRF